MTGSHSVTAATQVALGPAIETATVSLVRLDERLRRLADRADEAELAEGVVLRGHMLEARALVSLMGGVALLEDVVLHDSEMDARLPTPDVVRAVGLLRDRQSLQRRGPDTVLSEDGLRRFLGHADDVTVREETSPALPGPRRSGAPWEMPMPSDGEALADILDDEDDTLPPLDDEDETPAARKGPLDTWRPRGGDALDDALTAADAVLARSRRSLESFNDFTTAEGRANARLSDPAYDEAGRLSQWKEALKETEGLPTVLAASVALDAWLVLEPSEHRGEAGFLLASAMLAKGQLAGHHLPALAAGYRQGRFRWHPRQSRETRLAGWLAAIAESARAGQADLDRLTLAREVMLRRCMGRSRNSRLKDLVSLFVALPLVTVPLAAKKLGVSPQALEVMLKDLGSSLPRELTGRKRYRAWGIV